VEPTHRSKSLGLLVAALSVAAITAVIFPLRQVVPALSTGVLYLLAVLLVSTWWGVWLGLITALASALAFNFFHIPPTGRFTIADGQNWVALLVYFVAAVVTSTLADSARERAVEAEERRREADLSADLARLVLGGTDSSDGWGRPRPALRRRSVSGRPSCGSSGSTAMSGGWRSRSWTPASGWAPCSCRGSSRTPSASCWSGGSYRRSPHS
jgi:hypothetical protein